MSSIALTLGTRASLESLRLTTAAANETTMRLSTGLRVNSALDDATNFFTSRGLNARAAELNQLSDGFTNAIKTLEADANATKQTLKLLEQLEVVADEARKNAPPPDKISKAILSHSFTAATDSIQTVPSLAGEKPYLTIWAPGETPVTHKFSTDGGTVQDLINTINGAANGVTASFNATTGKIDLDGAGKLAMTLGGTEGSSGLNVKVYQSGGGIGNLAQAEAVVTGGTYLGEFQTTSIDYPTGGGANSQNGRMRSFVGPDGSDFVDSLGDPNPNGPVVNRMVFVIEGTITIPAGGAQGFDVYSDDGFEVRVGGTQVALHDANTAPTLRNYAISAPPGPQSFRMIYWENGGQEAVFLSLKDQGGNDIPIAGDLIPTIAGEAPSTEYYDRALGLQSQLNDLVSDSSYLGRTVGEGDQVNVALNERGTRLELTTKPVTSIGLGLEKLTQIDWLSDFDKVDAAITEARRALESHSAATANDLAVLQIRKDFNDSLISTLQGGADKLVLADTNAEGARLLASQTRMQFSSEALLMATRSDQGVLGLFR